MLSRNIISSIITQIPLFILGVFASIITTRVLGENTKGLYTIFQANAQLFVMLFIIGIDTSIVYFISSKKESEKKVLGIAIKIITISSILVLLILWLGDIFKYNRYYIPEELSSFKHNTFLYLIFLITIANSILSAFFRAYSKFVLINKVSLFNSIVNTSFFAVIFFLVSHSEFAKNYVFDLILISTIISLLLNLSIWIYFFNKQINLTPDFESISILKPFIFYGFSVHVGVLINFFNYRLDLWIVNLLIDNKNLSYYSLSTNLVQIILYISVTVASVLLPYLSGKSKEEKIKLFQVFSKLNFSFFILITFIAFILSGLVIPIMYGKEFIQSILPFQVLLIGILFSCSTQLFSIFILSMEKNIYNIIACSIGLVFTVVLDYILIKKLGIFGGALATAISYFIIFVSTYLFVLKLTNWKSYNLIFINKNDIKIALDVFRSK
jgi:O-antigen/teichoic acid export membrane protein